MSSPTLATITSQKESLPYEFYSGQYWAGLVLAECAQKSQWAQDDYK